MVGTGHLASCVFDLAQCILAALIFSILIYFSVVDLHVTGGFFPITTVVCKQLEGSSKCKVSYNTTSTGAQP